jgi:hypothetical protein
MDEYSKITNIYFMKTSIMSEDWMQVIGTSDICGSIQYLMFNFQHTKIYLN